jgi:hypothetical protein
MLSWHARSFPALVFGGAGKGLTRIGTVRDREQTETHAARVSEEVGAGKGI